MTERELQTAILECARLFGCDVEWVEPSPPVWAIRFSERVEITPSGCWTWTGATSGNGYGAFSVDGRQVGAHQAAYFISHGEWLPTGTVVRHSCDNPLCVRPSHLLSGTVSDNARDSVERRRNHQTKKERCPQGHAYDYVDPRGYRQCRTCRREALRRFKARRAGGAR